MECPYINNELSECCQTLNIQNLTGAYELCMDQYQRCPVYLKLRGQMQNITAVPEPVVLSGISLSR